MIVHVLKAVVCGAIIGALAFFGFIYSRFCKDSCFASSDFIVGIGYSHYRFSYSLPSGCDRWSVGNVIIRTTFCDVWI